MQPIVTVPAIGIRSAEAEQAQFAASNRGSPGRLRYEVMKLAQVELVRSCSKRVATAFKALVRFCANFAPILRTPQK